MSQQKRIEEMPGPFNKLIAARMRELQMERLEEFAAYAGIGETTLYNLVLGRVSPSGRQTRPSIDTLVALAVALEKPTEELLFILVPDAPRSRGEAGGDPAPVRRFQVKVAGWVGAGPQQDEEIDEAPLYVEESFARGKVLHAFRVRGDSMAAGKRPILHGDRVLVDANDKGDNTASVVARLSSGGYVCKMLKVDRHGKYLQSRNPEHTNGTPTSIPMEEVDKIIGRVIRVISDWQVGSPGTADNPIR